MKNIFLILILTVLIVLSGCNFGIQTIPFIKKEDSTPDSGGLINRGVTLNFVEGSPRLDGIELDIPFRVKVSLKNWGLNPISGDIYLSDKFKEPLTAFPGKVYGGFSINGADRVSGRVIPKEKDIDFGKFQYTDLRLTETTIRAELRYNYDTEFGTQICVKADNAIVTEQECPSRTIIGDLGYEAQHSPVTVTNIRQEMNVGDGGADITLYLTFQDFGGGLDCISDGLGECTNLLDITNAIELAGESPLNCNKKIISFKDKKKAEVFCRTIVSLPDNNFFQTPLTIRLNYNYRSIIPTPQILIKRPDTDFMDDY